MNAIKTGFYFFASLSFLHGVLEQYEAGIWFALMALVIVRASTLHENLR